MPSVDRSWFSSSRRWRSCSRGKWVRESRRHLERSKEINLGLGYGNPRLKNMCVNMCKSKSNFWIKLLKNFLVLSVRSRYISGNIWFQNLDDFYMSVAISTYSASQTRKLQQYLDGYDAFLPKECKELAHQPKNCPVMGEVIRMNCPKFWFTIWRNALIIANLWLDGCVAWWSPK